MLAIRCMILQNDMCNGHVHGVCAALLLLVVVQLDGKVLPVGLINGNRVQRLPTAIQDLEVILITSRLANDLSSPELDLVGRVIGRLMPNILFSISSNCSPTKYYIDSPNTHASNSTASPHPA